MGNILQRFSANRGSMTLHTPEAEPPKSVSDQNCEKSPVPLPVEEGMFLTNKTLLIYERRYNLRKKLQLMNNVIPFKNVFIH